jgi:hypothetical protein
MPIDLNERLEHALDIDRANADAGVFHTDTHRERQSKKR